MTRPLLLRIAHGHARVAIDVCPDECPLDRADVCANAHRSIATKIKKTQGLSGPKGHQDPIVNFRPWKLPVPSAREPIASERLPEATAQRFGRVEDSVLTGRIAKSTWRRHRSERLLPMLSANQSVHWIELHLDKPSCNALDRVSLAHVKSP